MVETCWVNFMVHWFHFAQVCNCKQHIAEGKGLSKHTHVHTHTHMYTCTHVFRLHACSETGVCGFLKSSCFLSRMFVTNQEFIVVIKTRVKAHLQLCLLSACTCCSSLDDFGNQLFKCRIGAEWDCQNSVFVHLMASMFTSVQHFHSKTLVISMN